MIPLLVPEISPCDAACAVLQELCILVVGLRVYSTPCSVSGLYPM